MIRDKRVLKLIGKYLRAGSDGGRGGGSKRGRNAARRAVIAAAGQHLPGRTGSRNWSGEGIRFCRYADDCNIYVGSQAAAERMLASIQGWIEKHLRLKVNAAKSGTGRTGNEVSGVSTGPREADRKSHRRAWSDSKRRCGRSGGVARVERVTNCGTTGDSYIRGWWGYYRLAENRQPIDQLEGWIRRHIRKCFWLRWHGPEGRERRLRRLGLRGQMLKVAEQFTGSLASGPDRESAKGALERSPTAIRLSHAIGPSGIVTPLGSTAGCGKPHVRWCGRVTGRNPRHSTRHNNVTNRHKLKERTAWDGEKLRRPGL